ncbi:MAG: hypothetical protein ACT4PG_01685 [Panacagrimonas sp.]
MFPLLRSRPLIWIALLAWAAQLCLPAAHAAVMAEQGAGLATWCGARSPGMEQKIAQLPAEVRQILQKSSAQAEQHQDCAQFCLSAIDDGLATSAVSVQLREAGLEKPAPVTKEQPRRVIKFTPPVRGPPLTS